jgi:hypothetical protein
VFKDLNATVVSGSSLPVQLNLQPVQPHESQLAPLRPAARPRHR